MGWRAGEEISAREGPHLEADACSGLESRQREEEKSTNSGG
jgi:hypothetical protein